jgi:hypothetical protein
MRSFPLAQRNLFKPSAPEMLFLAIMMWLVAFTVTGDETGMGLLRDSQTGYHIRVGEYVMQKGEVPQTDFMSFTMPGRPFYAWEWLAGIGSAKLHQWGGLRAIITFSALILGLSVLVMLRQLASLGVNLLVAVFWMHLVIGASSIHYLARPHIFTLLFLCIGFWLLQRDETTTDWRIWLLAPITALWVNLHGGFFGLLVSMGILTSGSIAESIWYRWVAPQRDPEQAGQAQHRAIRLATVTAACFAASLLNPYGIFEHRHLVEFMRETWYLTLTEEYQPPNLLSGQMIYYVLLLIAGGAVSVRLIVQRRFGWALLVLAWGYASLKSVRHIPIYAMAVLPHAAAQSMLLWRRWVDGKSKKSVAGLLENVARDYEPAMVRTSLAAPILAAALFLIPFDYPSDFPKALYPVSIVDRHTAEIAKARVFTTDGWGHYLTYRYPPPFGIFIDGRCDFFGQSFTYEYLDALNGKPGWDKTLDRYQVNMVLLPPDAGMTAKLRTKDSGWKLVDENPESVLFERPAIHIAKVHQQ